MLRDRLGKAAHPSMFRQHRPKFLGEIGHLAELGDAGPVQPGQELTAPESGLTQRNGVFHQLILSQVLQIGFRRRVM